MTQSYFVESNTTTVGNEFLKVRLRHSKNYNTYEASRFEKVVQKMTSMFLTTPGPSDTLFLVYTLAICSAVFFIVSARGS